jgi:general nucleoside transport system permease protein
MSDMAEGLVASLLASSLQSGTVLLYPTLGEIMSERAGVLNLGIEGMMLCGAFAGFLAALVTGNPYLGLVAGGLAGAALAAIHALVSITLRGNQTVSGLALTIFGAGITSFYGDAFQTTRLERPLPQLPIPGLSEIPFLGPVFFDHDLAVYLSWVLGIALWVVLFPTQAGIRLRAVGENARAASAMGVDVARTRWFWTLSGGFLAGIGGSYVTLAMHPLWLNQMTAGRGWIAVALVVFALWNPLYAFAGAWLFGSVEVLQFQLQAMGTYVNSALLSMLPYVLTLVCVTVVSILLGKRHGGVPRELGQPFARGER